MLNSGVYVGTIQEVYPPGHNLNETRGYQYMYEVAVVTELSAFLPVKCVRVDPIGGEFNYDDLILVVGQQVFLGFPFEDSTRGVILGSSRQVDEDQEVDGDVRWKRRLNEIDQSISFDGVWKLGHKSTSLLGAEFYGPSITVSKDILLIDDGGVNGDQTSPQTVEVDARNRTIKINSGEWTLQAESGVTINVSAGDVSVSCLNASVDAKQEATVKAGTNVSVDAGANAKVTAGGNAAIEGSQVFLNSKGLPLDGVITTKTQPTCYVTGIPFKGSTTVLAGE